MHENFNPKVSIIIPVYNGVNFLKEAIDSALSQTYKNTEVIVINDGSDDMGKTEKIAKSYGKKIRYFYKKNGGVASALNYGISEMDGEYFSWLSHDDIYKPKKVSDQIKILCNHSDKTTIVYSGYRLINSKGEKIEDIDFLRKHSKKQLENSLYPFFHLCINGCTLLIHKKYFKEIGLFDESLSTTQDYDFWYRLFRKGKIFYDSNLNLLSRSHPAQESVVQIEKHIGECNNFWTNILLRTSKEEMELLEGSELSFYENIYYSFQTLTKYDEVQSFLLKKLLDMLVSDFLAENNTQEKRKKLRELYKILNVSSNVGEITLSKALNYKNKKRKRIMFFTGSWSDRGGINRVISVLCNELSKYYEVFICTMKDNGNRNGFKLSKKVRYIELESNEFLSLPKLCVLFQIDVFIGSNNYFVPFLKLYKEIKYLGVKTIMWNHEFYFFPYNNIDLLEAVKFRKEVFTTVDAVLWLTNLSALICRNYSDKVGVIPNPINVSSKNKITIRKGINIISVGRFNTYQKRLDRLLEVFSEIIKKEKARLYIVGQVDFTMKIVRNHSSLTIESLIKELKIPKKSIIFTGEVNNVEKFYKKALINIVTSEKEGFGLTILEAGEYGVPSIAFDNGGPSDIIHDNIDGYLIEDNNIAEMAGKVTNLIYDKIKYKSMSIAVNKNIQNYRVNIICKKWKKLIDSLVDKKDLNKILELEINNCTDNHYLFKRAMFNYEGALDDRISDGIKLKSLEDELINTRDKLKNIENSKSWRLTGPIRKIDKGIGLFRTQGIQTTVKNYILKKRKNANKK